MPGTRRGRCRNVRKNRYVALLYKSKYETPSALYHPRNWVLIGSPALIGTVEELSASQQTLNLVRDQFEINYFGPLNIIKACLPHMRRQKSGHIMILSGITAHIGTPGLGMYCAAGWALEGFCDVRSGCYNVCCRQMLIPRLSRVLLTRSRRSMSNSQSSSAVSR